MPLTLRPLSAASDARIDRGGLLVTLVRPSANYEVAKARFAELRQKTPENQPLTFTQLAPVIRPLQKAVTQAPALPEVFTLLAEAWTRWASGNSAIVSAQSSPTDKAR